MHPWAEGLNGGTAVDLKEAIKKMVDQLNDRQIQFVYQMLKAMLNE